MFDVLKWHFFYNICCGCSAFWVAQKLLIFQKKKKKETSVSSDESPIFSLSPLTLCQSFHRSHLSASSTSSTACLLWLYLCHFNTSILLFIHADMHKFNFFTSWQTKIHYFSRHILSKNAYNLESTHEMA